MADTVDQRDNVPTMKVQAATAASAATTVIVWAANEFAGVDVPVLVAGALTTLLVFVAGYFKREKKETPHAG